MRIKLRFIILSVLPVIAIISILSGCKQKQEKNTISVSGAFALYPLTVKWAEEYRKLHPEITIDVSAGGAGKGMTDVLSDMVDLAMFSRSVSQEELDKGAWAIAVSRDAVVPMINAANRHLDILHKRGLKQKEFEDIYLNEKYSTWNALLGVTGDEKLNIYTRSDACGAAEMWGKYLGKNQEDLEGIGVFGDPGMADAVGKDPNGLGYNNIIYAYDIKTRKTYYGLEVAPIDINANGLIDSEENFYSSLDSVMAAIRDRRYPSPPARDLFLISHGAPKKEAVKKFLHWILTEGQQYVNDAGYVQLQPDQIDAEKEKLK